MAPLKFARLKRKLRDRAVVMTTIGSMTPLRLSFRLKATKASLSGLITLCEFRQAIKDYASFSKDLNLSPREERLVLNNWLRRHQVLEVARMVSVKPVAHPRKGRLYFRPSFTKEGVSKCIFNPRSNYDQWLASEGYLFPSTSLGKRRAKEIMRKVYEPRINR